MSVLTLDELIELFQNQGIMTRSEFLCHLLSRIRSIQDIQETLDKIPASVRDGFHADVAAGIDLNAETHVFWSSGHAERFTKDTREAIRDYRHHVLGKPKEELAE